jgi:hypothetical protein
MPTSHWNNSRGLCAIASCALEEGCPGVPLVITELVGRTVDAVVASLLESTLSPAIESARKGRELAWRICLGAPTICRKGCDSGLIKPRVTGKATHEIDHCIFSCGNRWTYHLYLVMQA